MDKYIPTDIRLPLAVVFGACTVSRVLHQHQTCRAQLRRSCDMIRDARMLHTNAVNNVNRLTTLTLLIQARFLVSIAMRQCDISTLNDTCGVNVSDFYNFLLSELGVAQRRVFQIAPELRSKSLFA